MHKCKLKHWYKVGSMEIGIKLVYRVDVHMWTCTSAEQEIGCKRRDWYKVGSVDVHKCRTRGRYKVGSVEMHKLRARYCMKYTYLFIAGQIYLYPCFHGAR